MSGKRYSNRVRIALQLNDLAVLNFSFFLATYYSHSQTLFWKNQKQTLFLLFLNLLWAFLTSYGDIYAIRRVIKIEKELNKTFSDIAPLFNHFRYCLLLSIIRF